MLLRMTNITKLSLSFNFSWGLNYYQLTLPSTQVISLWLPMYNIETFGNYENIFKSLDLPQK